MTVLDVLVNRVGGEGDMASHLLLLYSLARFLPIVSVVEIGVDVGQSTQALLAGLQDGQHGHLFSVDIAACEQAWARFGGSDRWTFTRMSSAQYAAECDTVIDLLLIDGDHTYEGCKADWDAYVPKVRSGGFVLLHDYHGCFSRTHTQVRECPACNGVRRVVDEKAYIHPMNFECVTLPYGWGLSVVRVR